MLINALNSYYDILEEAEKLVPEQYSRQDVDYLVALTADGKVAEIIDQRTEVKIPGKKGKAAVVKKRKQIILPRRTQKTSIDANFVEHRPFYLFGLEYNSKNKVFEYKPGGKADKSHQAFKVKTEEWFGELRSPLAKAYYHFSQNWDPEYELDNPKLKALGSDYSKSYFSFCMEGDLTQRLESDSETKNAWEDLCRKTEENREDIVEGQCAITGENQVAIARIHNKISGLVAAGGHSTGCVLIGYKEKAFQSYGREYSYNSNISESAMEKYTAAMNYLLASPVNHINYDDTMMMFWAQSKREKEDDLMSILLSGGSSLIAAQKADDAMKALLVDAESGRLTFDRLRRLYDGIEPEDDFYFVGMKPNGPRIAIKFIYRQKYGTVLQNIAQHQLDMMVMPGDKPVSMERIRKELISPKSTNEKVSPALMEGVFQSMILGTEYPQGLMQKVLYRLRTDHFSNQASADTVKKNGDSNNTDNNKETSQIPEWLHNRVRIGIVKACLCRYQRKRNKEELTVGLDKENSSQAYLCGRLFAVIQKLQEEANGKKKLNRTIQDAYFASASVKPSSIFPELLRLAQIYMKKLNDQETAFHTSVFYEKLIEEIIEKLNHAFPQTLMLFEQGEFMIGYYQQYQDFYKKKEDE